ncbi:MAG: CDP-diacylglycerol--glycerol-3-phosphate 3-phosphatidyltransferase [Christensenellaceae bacterium]|nr:CDP-diacylglycerol--glycerol-3-phosphate 3-phosphatidyltransferase [Christensenellaceae bacterium]
MKKLPNILTVLRIALVPFFIASYYLKVEWWNYLAAGIFIVASVTDFLDGSIARKYNCVSKFGKLMDPIADKVLFCSALFIMLDWGQVDPISCIVLVAREFIISGFRILAASEGVVIAAGWSGKIKTVVQLVGISLILLKNPIFNLIPLNMGLILIYISVVLSIWSCVEYIVKNRQVLKG